MEIAPPDIHWRAPGVPDGPRLHARLLSGELFRQGATDYLLSNRERFGDLVRFRALGRAVFQFNHPELIGDMLVRNERLHHRNLVMQRSKFVLGEGLLTSEEPLHMRQRRLAQPAFHRARIAAYGATIAQATEAMLATWQSGEVREVHADMLLLALRIVGRTLFSLELEDDVQPIADAVDAFQSFLPLAFVPFSQFVQALPLPLMRRIQRGRRHLDRLIYRILAERRADPTDRGDLLSMLLATVETEGGAEQRMSDRQVRDECLTVLLAGHETTANALSFALHQLAQEPELQEQLAAEAEAVLGERTATADDYPHLPFAEQIFAEALRLYPPVWVTSRMAAEDYEYRGARIPRGAFLLAPQFVIHRDPRFWDDPLRFDPGRFTKERKAERPKLAYFPFGAGSRQCIGEGLAWMEGVLALATVARSWRLRLPGDSATALKMKPSVTLRPSGPVPLRVEQRSPGSRA